MKWGLSLTAHYYQVDARGLCKGLKCNHCELVLIYPVTLMKHINRDTSWYFRKTIPFPLFPLKECVLGSTRVEGQVAQLRIWSLIRSFPGRDSGSNLPVPRVTPRDYLHLHPDYQFDATRLFFSPANTSHGTDSLENLSIVTGARMRICR